MKDYYNFKNYKKIVDDFLSSSACLEDKEDFLSTEQVDIQKVLDQFEKETDEDDEELFNRAIKYDEEALNMLRDGKYLTKMKINRSLTYLKCASYLTLCFLSVYSSGFLYHKMSGEDDRSLEYSYKLTIFLEVISALYFVYRAKNKYDEGKEFTESIDEYKNVLKKGIDLDDTKIKH